PAIVIVPARAGDLRASWPGDIDNGSCRQAIASVKPSQLLPAADAPRPWPATRLRIASVQPPQRYTFRRCPYLACGRPRSRLEHLASTYEISSSGRVQQNPSVCNRRYKRRCSTCLDVWFLLPPFLGDRVSVYRRAKPGLDLVFVRTFR